MNSKILLIEDDESFFDCISLLLKNSLVDVVWAENGAKGIQIYKQDPQNFSTVIIDYILPDLKGTEVCRHLRKINPDQEFLFASGHFELEYLTDQLETGSAGFLKKGSSISEMKNKILQVIEKFNQKNRLLSSKTYTPTESEILLKQNGFIGRSSIMASMLKEIESARLSKYPTLIIGETGSGKELVAKALTEKDKKIISINCASFCQRENLLESELFGYVKGAFTGANADTVGLVTKAHNQVLFLDELHQLPLSAQAKLLRFLQEMKFRRVGDNSETETKVNFKLVAAVQPDVRERMRDKTFLTDLFERVSTLTINVPPLRDRAEDIEPLVMSIQDEFNLTKNQKDKKQFKLSTLNEMKKYLWPTNIRGLQNAVRQMMTICEGDTINPIDFKNYLTKSHIQSEPSILEGSESSLSHERALRDFEIKHLVAFLKKSKTRSEAAVRLGLPLTTLIRKLTAFDIDPSMYLQA